MFYTTWSFYIHAKHGEVLRGATWLLVSTGAVMEAEGGSVGCGDTVWEQLKQLVNNAEVINHGLLTESFRYLCLPCLRKQELSCAKLVLSGTAPANLMSGEEEGKSGVES